MGLAVIAAEDQKFPDHWGFDVPAIEKALAHNERNENRIRGASTLSADGENLFYGMAAAGCARGWKWA